MSSSPEAKPARPKKSVALSGVVAGNTALCSVGRSGNDLHYRGYDIYDLAAHCEFEEVAHPMVVVRTGVSALGCVLPEKLDLDPAGAREIIDRLLASAGSMLLYWHHF